MSLTAMTVVREKEQRGSTVLSSGRHTDPVVSGAAFKRIEIAEVNATVVEGRRRASAHWTSIGRGALAADRLHQSAVARAQRCRACDCQIGRG